jgi:hypothetical protein
VKLLGLDTKRNFPDEVISEPPASLGDQRRESKTSRFSFGVCWNTDDSVWVAYLTDPQTKRTQRIGCYDSEVDAARAFDCAAVKMHGPGYSERNFPDEVISQPASRGDLLTSRFNGVSWNIQASAWKVQLYNQQTKCKLYIGIYDSETAAAMAYDCASQGTKVCAGQGTKVSGRTCLSSAVPVSLGADKRILVLVPPVHIHMHA